MPISLDWISDDHLRYIVIAAMDKEGGFSKDGGIPWYYSEDFKWFKYLTDGHVCIMGRNTYQDIHERMGDKGYPNVLPGRRCFVVSSTLTSLPNAVVIRSITEVENYITDKGTPIFIIGGGLIYEEGVQIANEIYLTVINKVFNCDKFLPIGYIYRWFDFQKQCTPIHPDLSIYKLQRYSTLQLQERNMLLSEIKKQKGTYAGVQFDDKTKDNIMKYIKDNKIPNGLSADKLHTTLLYSRKFLPEYKPAGVYDQVMEGNLGEFVVWPSNNEDGTTTNCLVIKYDCDSLIKRHKDLMSEHKATYDFPKYEPHITLSYDIGDMDIKKLPNMFDTVPVINITHEYSEDLDLSWSQHNG